MTYRPQPSQWLIRKETSGLLERIEARKKRWGELDAKRFENDMRMASLKRAVQQQYDARNPIIRWRESA